MERVERVERVARVDRVDRVVGLALGRTKPMSLKTAHATATATARRRRRRRLPAGQWPYETKVRGTHRADFPGTYCLAESSSAQVM